MIGCLIFSELPQKGFLLEASFSLEDRYVPRGQKITYTYVIQQRHKDIEETAMRNIFIPWDKADKGGNCRYVGTQMGGGFWVRPKCLQSFTVHVSEFTVSH